MKKYSDYYIIFSVWITLISIWIYFFASNKIQKYNHFASDQIFDSKLMVIRYCGNVCFSLIQIWRHRSLSVHYPFERCWRVSKLLQMCIRLDTFSEIKKNIVVLSLMLTVLIHWSSFEHTSKIFRASIQVFRWAGRFNRWRLQSHAK